MIKIAVIGTGKMANVRTRTFLSSPEECEICCVASKHIQNARVFAKGFGCQQYTDNYQELLRFKPDAVLIEVPHSIQDEIALWALKSGLHTLIGGCLATNIAMGIKIARLADEKDLIVETGYEARYKDVWCFAKEYLNNGKIGEIIATRSIALYDADPNSWYYNEKQSGGMVLTHMTYAFINPVRWIFGAPLFISAFSNNIREKGMGKVKHETCTANFLFKDDIVCNMTASYVKPKQLDAWKINFLGSDGSIDIFPGDMNPGSLTIYSDEQVTLTQNFSGQNNAFEKQAKVFLSAIGGNNQCLNQAWDSILDIQISEAIVKAAENKTTLEFNPIVPN